MTMLLMAGLFFALVPAASLASPISPRGPTSQLMSSPGRCVGENINSTQRRGAAIQAMTCLTNIARKRVGRRSVSGNVRLDNSASSKGADIIGCTVFSHTACNHSFTWWIAKTYIKQSKCWLAGETIAWGNSSLGSSREIFRAWMNSPTHRAAILSRQYRELGLGFRIGNLRGMSGVRVWVMHLGTLC